MPKTDEIEQEFREFEGKIERLKNAEKELNALASPELREVFPEEISAMEAKIKDPKKVDDIEQQLRDLKEKLVPNMSISLSRTDFELDTWSDVDLVLENTGDAPARKIAVSMPDKVETDGIGKLQSLPDGQKARIAVRLKPHEAGKVPLKLTVSFEDLNGVSHTREESVDIEVSETKARVEPTLEQKPPLYFPSELLTIYSAIEFVNKGGFARVFKAQRKSDGTPIAVKIPIDMDPAVGKSFLKEIENWQKLSHDNITRLLDFNILPAVYLEMELCEQSLDKLPKPLLVERAAYIILEITRGLRHAHGKKIIHRDLKPSNILLLNDIPKISDWGLSRVKSESRLSATTSLSPMYAAPEQYSPKTFGKKDERTDIFQLGIIFYELATGELPFTGEDLTEISYAITAEAPKPPSEINPEATDIEPIILKCLQKKKEERYQSVAELQSDLASFLCIDFKKSLNLSRNRLEKIKLCSDLIEVYASQGNGQKCLLYLSNMHGYASTTDLRDMVHEEIQTLAFYIDKEVDIKDRIPRLEEIIHRARMGE